MNDHEIMDDMHSVLSDVAILAHLRAGTVVIEPFNQDHLSTSSYDVSLGQHFYREVQPAPGETVFNFYSKSAVDRVWGAPQCAETHLEWAQRTGNALLENIAPDERLIFLRPGETILGHTEEYIGGAKCVTTMMKARSSLGRCFIEVCKCAGWGGKFDCN
jgi:deoxycytidine triphosphate deaminase